MDLKDQRIGFAIFICFIIFIFVALGILDKHRVRIQSLERNQISISSKIDALEKVNQVQAGLDVIVTAYNAVKSQTDSTPNRTASNKKPIEGYCGVSRDLEKLLGLKFGDIFYLEGLNRYEGKYVFPICQFQDRMHKRKEMQVDIFMESVKDAKEFGIRKAKLFIIREK